MKNAPTKKSNTSGFKAQKVIDLVIALYMASSIDKTLTAKDIRKIIRILVRNKVIKP